MHQQRNNKFVVAYFRANRKCYSLSGCLLCVLILTAATIQKATARSFHGEDLQNDFDYENDLKDENNLEIHRVKVVDGVQQEDHPIIIYKEDFVTEDYVPPKNHTKRQKMKHHNKGNAHRRRHTKHNFTDIIIEEKSEKTLFDIIPEKPLIVPEDMEMHETSYMKLEPLIKDFSKLNETHNQGGTFKEELEKRPKKFHRRTRRNVNSGHFLHKRNPYFRHIPNIPSEVPTQVQYIYVKHSVPGKKHNSLDIPVQNSRPTSASIPDDISFGSRVAADEDDRVIFSSGRRTTSRTTSTPETIFRDPRPQNFDFSFMNQQRPATTTRRPIFTRRPETPKQDESIFRDPRPENFDFSFMSPQGQQSSFVTATAKDLAAPGRGQSSTHATVSKCVWAIVNCCSNTSSDIRYNCFEQNGCFSAFWDINPCADNVKDNFINYVADYYQ